MKRGYGNNKGALALALMFPSRTCFSINGDRCARFSSGNVRDKGVFRYAVRIGGGEEGHGKADIVKEAAWIL